MGICICHNTKNGLITSEVMVPAVINSTLNEKDQNNSIKTIPRIVQEKKLTKNLIRFSFVNTHASLSSILHDVNHEIMERSNHSQDKTKSKLTRQCSVSPEIKNRREAEEKSRFKSPKIIRSKTSMLNKEEMIAARDGDAIENKTNNYAYKCSSTVIPQDEESNLFKWLKNHYLFMSLADEIIQLIVDSINVYEINSETVIFKEGEVSNSFFIVKSGKVEIKGSHKKKSLMKGETFGELGLINPSAKRTYAAIAKSQSEIYCMTSDLYNKLVQQHIKDSEKEQYKEYIDKFFLFSSLSETIRNNLFLLSQIYIFNESNLLLLSNKINQKHTSGVSTTQKPFFSNPKQILFPFSGELIENFHNPEVAKKVTKGNGAGILYTLFKVYDNVEFDLLVGGEQCVCIGMTESMFFECIGLHYQYEIMFTLFDSVISSSEIMNKLIPKNEKNKKKYIDKIFQGFALKEYKSGEVIIPKCNYENKKYIIVLNGDVVNTKNNKTKVTKGELFGDEVINTNQDLDYNLVAKKNQTVVFECSWTDIKSVLKTFPENEELFDNFDNLSRVFLFQSFKEMELLNTGKKFKKTIYKSKEIILKEGEISSHLYLISKGRVKLKTPKTDKTFRVYDEGNCFGELSLLNDSPSSFNIVASENSICYLLDKDQFFDLLQDQKVNDFIKQKMLTEDTDITLEDLYYISYLGRGRFGNVCLVHNRIGLYAAKAISKLAAEKQKSGVKNLINEKKCMISLDHPFIVKMVKTLKKDNWCFFLQEFISGKNFAEYLDSRKTYKSVYETKFFGANMFTIIAHLNKRRIIHRDIKPSNIMLDYNGYLKLIDFGTARKLKNFSQTVIGTPNFIAPEVLLGKGYSFPCDYWSIGICLYYIYSGILPFGHKALELMDIYKEIIEKEPDFQKDCPYDIKSLLSGLLCKKPSQRIKSFEMVQSQYLYKDFHWDDLLKFKIKPYYIPEKDPRDNPDNLEIVNSPFETFMESEKFETIQMQTLKIHNNKEINRSNSLITPQWFNEF